MKRLTWMHLGFGLLLAVSARPGAAHTFLIEDLGNPGAAVIVPTDINRHGQVAGYLELVDGHRRAFLWTDGTFKVMSPLSGNTDSEGRGLNDQGKVVGLSWSGPRDGAKFNGVIWAPTYTRHLTSAGGDSVDLYDISNGGVIPGAVKRGDTWQAILWTPEGVWEIPYTERAVAVNERDEAVGWTLLGVEEKSSWLWHDGFFAEITRDFWDVDTRAVALNILGQVALNRRSDSRPETSAFRYTDRVYLSLGDLGGYVSEATAINDNGDVVGTSLTPEGYWHAFLFQDGVGLVDLNTQLPPESGWEVASANGINNRGQIVGTGSHNGEARAFRLTPLRTRPGSLRP
jgi:probable HAF family extracellular repeat protein